MALLDVYDNYGNKTGKIVNSSCRDDEFKKGEHIAVAIIYIENNNEQFLIQKTSEEKGGRYSATSGHVEHNEKPIDTIKREVKEELGIDISNENIIELGYLVVDFPVRFIFYLKKDIKPSDISLQKEEVESVFYMNLNEIKEVIKNDLMHKAHLNIIDKIMEYKNNKI